VIRSATVTFRDARPSDAQAIAAVHVASWHYAYRGLLPDAFLDRLSVEDRERSWGTALADPAYGVVVAEDAGRVVGFVSFGPSRDEGASDRTAEIPAIYVDPEVLGTGVGRRLFDAAVGRLREAGYARATLWVLEANDRARRFYEKAGWSWDGTVSHHQFECANEPIVRYAVDL
jgi:ribosomal protein S18 acetylase RimI-like enzyme